MGHLRARLFKGESFALLCEGSPVRSSGEALRSSFSRSDLMLVIVNRASNAKVRRTFGLQTRAFFASHPYRTQDNRGRACKPGVVRNQ